MCGIKELAKNEIYMDLKNIVEAKNFKSLALVTFYYTSGAIFGPLFFFGGAGYFIDQSSGTSPRYLLIGLLIAFLSSNVLLFKKVTKLNQIMSAYGQVKRKSSSVETTIGSVNEGAEEKNKD